MNDERVAGRAVALSALTAERATVRLSMIVFSFGESKVEMQADEKIK